MGATLAVSACLFAASAAAQAPAPAEEEDSGALQEVTVTAQFREENLQDTPIAITAVTAELLEARSQTNIFQVAAQAPNVTLQPSGQAFGPSMTAFIRGVGQTDFIFAVEPGVGIYIDDVYHSTLTGSLLDLMDLERVEVLRGPQGTLAGRNSIGGAIKLYSKLPTGDGGGELAVTMGTLDRVDIRGSAEFTMVPDKVFVRVAGASRQRDGYVDVLDYGCVVPNQTDFPTRRTSEGCKVGEMGDMSYTAGRVALRWLASDDVEVNIIGDMLNDTSGTPAGLLTFGNNPMGVGGFTGHRFVPWGPNRPAGMPINDPFVNFATLSDVTAPTATFPWKPVVLDSRNGLDMWGLSGKIEWRLADSLQLTSITGYRVYDTIFNVDSDLSPAAVTLLGSRLEHEAFTQEFRLNGSFGDRADWTLGAFYLDQENFYEARVDLNYAALDFIHGPDPTPSTTWALFAHSVWHFSDALNATVGVRYSDEKKDYQHNRHNPDGTVPGATGTPAGTNVAVGGVNGLLDHFEDNRMDWRVGLDYNFSDSLMTYVQTSTGYKGGGVNPRPFFPVQARPFEPETLTAYEIGFKSTLLDRRMRLNGAVFYNDYEDIQLTLTACERPGPVGGPAIIIGPPCAKPSNVGNAEVKGAELEMEFRLTDSFAVDSSASWLDFKYTEVVGAALTGSVIAPIDMVTPYTPEWKYALGATYSFPATALGTFVWRIDAAYQDEIYANATNAPTNLIDDYTLVTTRLAWTSPEDTWETALEVTNLTDELYFHTIFDQATSVGQVTAQPGLPRQWAISVKRRF